MALHLFLNDLILAPKGEKTVSSLTCTPPKFEIIVIDDNARPLWSNRQSSSFVVAQRHHSFQPNSSPVNHNRWGGLSKQERDACCVFTSPIIVSGESSLSGGPLERLTLKKIRSDESLVIPQRVESPSVLQTTRKRIQKDKKLSTTSDDISRPTTLLSTTVVSSSTFTTSSKRIPPSLQLSRRFQSPNVQKDILPKALSNNRKVEAPKFYLGVPGSRPRPSKASIAIIDEVDAILNRKDDDWASFSIPPAMAIRTVQQIPTSVTPTVNNSEVLLNPSQFPDLSAKCTRVSTPRRAPKKKITSVVIQ